ncbi:MAG TPA: carboxypeptidase-like regulatory domain-containing protein, partial [Salinimicrobium sp.]|nr:carboxypeptidase-like regulatory domain-containing protein [Salinimicrobium sp.]
SLVKARKSADYSRLDTLALKLRGGPFNPLVLDIMKNPDYMFYQEDLMNYEFEFDNPQKINNRYLYVINFEDNNKALPWYFGKLYIDAETKALVKADFEMNVDNRHVASNMFVKKKPGGTRVYPVFVAYKAEYRQQDGKWYFGYGNTEMEFLINWKRKLFNSRYKVNSELAVTDWTIGEGPEVAKDLYLKPDVIMADDVSGFVDLNFWGENNIIEPDKSIENAIEKIQEKMED